jgi:predicted exporter
MSHRVRLWFGLISAIGLALHVFFNFRVTNAITHFLPAGGDPKLAQLVKVSDLLAHGELTRTMLLSVTGPDTEHVLPAARALSDALRTRSELEWLRAGVPADMPERVYQLYFPRRYQFVSERPAEIAQLVTDAGLHERAQALKRELGSPMSMLVRRVASADPLLLFPRQLQRIEASRSPLLHPVGDQLVSSDGKRAFIFLATRASAFDTERQRPFMDFLDHSWAKIQRDSRAELTLGVSGMQRFALASEHVIRSDIQRVSSLSMLGTLLLFAWMFRSLRYLALGFVPLIYGLLCATSLCLWWFGELHGLTLAFGSSLIGVCVDYTIHYFNHHLLEARGATPDASLRRIWPALFMGGLTSAIGFAGLAFSSFPGIREIAVFSAVGVLSALLSMRAFIPPLLPAAAKPSRAQVQWSERLERAFGFVLARPRWQWAPALIALALTLVGLPRVRWVDDLRALLPTDPSLLAESDAVRTQVSAMDAGRFVIASGKTLEEALQRNDRAAPVLADAQRDGVLAGHQSLHAWLWSAQLQAENRRAVLAAPQLAERMQQAYAAEGFNAATLSEFGSSLTAPDPGPLTLELLADSALGALVRNFVVKSDDQVVVLSFVQGVRDAPALEQRLASCEGVVYFDQTAFLTGLYANFRARVVQLIGLGLIAVFLMVFSHYRRVAPTIAAFAPAVLAGCATAAILGMLRGPLTLLHAVALLLVLAMGVDFGIFLAESSSVRGGIGPTLLSLMIAALSMILSFGLLALSHVPALRAIGETTALGTLLSLALAPTVMLALRRVEAKP